MTSIRTKVPLATAASASAPDDRYMNDIADA